MPDTIDGSGVALQMLQAWAVSLDSAWLTQGQRSRLGPVQAPSFLIVYAQAPMQECDAPLTFCHVSAKHCLLEVSKYPVGSSLLDANRVEGSSRCIIADLSAYEDHNDFGRAIKHPEAYAAGSYSDKHARLQKGNPSSLACRLQCSNYDATFDLHSPKRAPQLLPWAFLRVMLHDFQATPIDQPGVAYATVHVALWGIALQGRKECSRTSRIIRFGEHSLTIVPRCFSGCFQMHFKLAIWKAPQVTFCKV